MMPYASAGVRTAARKGTNALVHQSGYNAPGGTASANPTSRSIHLTNHVRAPLHTPHVSSVIPPRNPSHRLFSASKNFLQRLFTHLSAPGLRAPTYLSQIPHNGARSLHSTAIRGTAILNGLSLPTRTALRNHAFRRQANMLLPRLPGPVPPRFGGVAQVGLGTARNFSSARPLFQQLVQNVPIAGRALYEIDWDIEMRKEHERLRLLATKDIKKSGKSRSMKQTQKMEKRNVILETTVPLTQPSLSIEREIEHYFPITEVAPVTTYLLIPLAPTTATRRPLPLDPVASPLNLSDGEPTLLPPLSYLGSFHVSHATHALRVSTLFTRLDQANVWSRGGVHCSSYSQGQAYQKFGDSGADDEGVCTILKVEFEGWTKAEVRAVIGESGTGWCVMEEVRKENSDEDSSDNDSLASYFDESQYGRDEAFDVGLGIGRRAGAGTIDPAQSFVMPTLDFSSSFLSSPSSWSPTATLQNDFQSTPSGMENDPWVDDFSSSSPRTSSYSDLSDIIDSRSTNRVGSDGVSGRPVGISSYFYESQSPREAFY